MMFAHFMGSIQHFSAFIQKFLKNLSYIVALQCKTYKCIISFAFKMLNKILSLSKS